MIKVRSVATAFAVTLLYLPPAVEAQSLAASAPAVDAVFSEVFSGWDPTGSPGCAVGASMAGEPPLIRTYGMADLEHGIPISAGTIFEAGSVSKQFAAAAIVLLVLDGSLTLDDSVRDYIPELPDYADSITIRHLFNHTSGLRDWGSVASLSGWGRGDRSHDHGDVLEILTRQNSLNYLPGEEYSYTNSGYNLLAIIVDRVSGRSLADFSQDRIFEPLGLENTQWRDDYRRIVPGRSGAYSRSDGSFIINRPIEDVYGNGGLLTTVEDLLRWTSHLETGEGLGGERFVTLMHDEGYLNDGRPTGYAAGLRVGERKGIPVVDHTGSTAGYRAYLGRFPDQGLSVALLCNIGSVNPGDVGGRVADVLLGDAVANYAAAGDVTGIDLPSDLLHSRAGLYRDRENDHPLTLSVTNRGLRASGGVELVAVSPEVFQVVGESRLFYVFSSSSERGRSSIRLVEGETLSTATQVASFEPVDPFDPSFADLAEYTGSYHSDEADAELIVEIDDGELVLRHRPSSRIALTPLYADVFSGYGTVRFVRNAEGEISGMRVRQARVHDLLMERLASER